MIILQVNPSPVVAGERKVSVVRGAAPVRGEGGARRAGATGASRASGQAVSCEISGEQSQVLVVVSKARLGSG